ncbi:MAG: type III-B CRISPR module RAMP protein Cmr6 [Bacteroidetes bacterium]|nr:MAG: type III-B CRISPR module RAMP protein Cmr6 [Bacteroidota bacterium]
MPHPNAGWLYYKKYYWDIDFTVDPNDRKSQEAQRRNEHNQLRFDRANEALCALKLPEKPFDPLEHSTESGLYTFEAATTYPGLLLGSGYQHETGHKGELKLGYYFDHTSGLPIIPGSSIKGMLRACFRHHDLIQGLLHKPQLNVSALEQAIFCGKDLDPETKTYQPRPMPLHDCFFDAFPIGSLNPKERRIFEQDYLTPHNPRDGAAGQFKEPVPVSFLKVRPDILYRFRFRLEDHEALGVTARQKYGLFSELIELFGLGAKTAVGYGHFVMQETKIPDINPNPAETIEKPQSPSTPETPLVQEQPLPNYTFSELKAAYRKGGNIIGLVKDNVNKQLLVEYMTDGSIRQATIRYAGSSSITVGARVRLKVTSPGKANQSQAPTFGFAGYER